MKKKRTLIVGDIHGCLNELKRLLKKMDYSDKDHLIFIGDLINKGPDSFGVLKFVRNLNAECILGNHEDNLLNPSKKKLFHYLAKDFGEKPTEWLDWISSWPLFIDDPEFLAVHAGFRPDLKLRENSKETLTRIRTWDGHGIDLQNPNNPAWYEFYQGSKLVVYGHYAQDGLKVRKNTIGLDSGCVYGKQLSALVLPERTIVQVEATQAYTAIQ